LGRHTIHRGQLLYVICSICQLGSLLEFTMDTMAIYPQAIIAKAEVWIEVGCPRDRSSSRATDMRDSRIHLSSIP
jgi:hypothetical protein